MKSKLALFLATLLFFNIILPIRVSAASVQDQSKPIFGLTADQVVEKYNQLTDQQKDQVLRSLGNTSIFANSLFGNIFNSTFGVLDDAVKKLGDLFFQVNGVVYKLGSSALAWVSRLIDKVFNNDLTDINISQPVIDDLYKNTRSLDYLMPAFFNQGNTPSIIFNSYLNTYLYSSNKPVLSDYEYLYVYNQNTYNFQEAGGFLSSDYLSNPYVLLPRIVLDLDYNRLLFTKISFTLDTDNLLVPSSYIVPSFTSYNSSYNQFMDLEFDALLHFSTGNASWEYGNYSYKVDYLPPVVSVSSSDYLVTLKNYLFANFSVARSYVFIQNGRAQILPINSAPSPVNVTNNTYYNYIYNIPVETPLNVTNLVSNTAIHYNPVENIAYYLPDQYDIEQNFIVVNNYYISSASAISGQAIDVNIVSPGVIDVRIINPEDISQEVTNNISKDLILNFDLDYGDLVLEPKLEVNLNQNLNSIKPEVTSSGGIVSGFAGGIPPDLFKLITVLFGISLLVACLYHGSN